MPIAAVEFNQGVVTSRARERLSQGELQAATGGYYKTGDTERLWKLPGRSLFAASGAGARKIDGLALCSFDAGTDRLLALAGGTIYSSTPGTTGAFSSLVTGLNTAGQTLSAAHMNDRWYLGNGYDRNRVLESDGTVRLHGMIAPQVPLTTAKTSLAASTQRPTAVTNGAGSSAFQATASAYDVESALTFSTFSYAVRSTAGTSTCIWKTFGADATANRSVRVYWRLVGLTAAYLDDPGHVGQGGGTSDLGCSVNVLIKYSVDSGADFTTLVDRRNMTVGMAQIALDSAVITANSNLVQVQVSLTFNSGSSSAMLQVWDIRTQGGSAATNYTTVGGGMYYAITEYDEVRGLESPIGPVAGPVTLTAQNIVTIGIDGTPLNATTTKWRVYRTFDGGTVPLSLGLIAAVPVAQNVYRDTFENYPPNIAATPLYRLKSITVDTGVLRFSLDTPPPALRHISTFQGSLMGLRLDKPRSLCYSEPGYAESWPECNVVESFPMPEHDKLIGSVTIGEIGHLIGAQGTMFLLTSLPRVILGTFSPESKVEPLKGQPGLVSQDALVAFSVEGEARAAWVSRFGIHETSGLETRLLSSEQDWDAEIATENLSSCVLRWDPQRRVLIFCYPSGQIGNDRVWLLHMGPEHRKDNGLPKITKPHYGKIASLASGEVAGEYLIWSGHTANGNVYTEFSGVTDASQSYSGTILPFIVTTARSYGAYRQIGIYKGSLRHSDFGAGQSCSLVVSLGRDESGSVQAPAKTVSLAGQKGHEFLVARSGDWAEVTLTHLGIGSGGLSDIRLETLSMGQTGRTATT